MLSNKSPYSTFSDSVDFKETYEWEKNIKSFWLMAQTLETFDFSVNFSRNFGVNFSRN